MGKELGNAELWPNHSCNILEIFEQKLVERENNRSMQQFL